jgi:tRNA U34 5-methylaminomethyl-2-thiouridine-forming methyltransferase MnmC
MIKEFTTEKVITSDGSHTLYVPGLNEHYHSVNGARAESEHVFIKAGLEYAAGQFDPVSLLEVGFGTGLNALLALSFAEDHQLCLTYTGLEPCPPEEELLHELNYPDFSDIRDASSWWQRIHFKALWNEKTTLGEWTSFCKYKVGLEDFSAPPESFNLVFFDAFAPLVQPELWTESAFVKIASMMQEGGILVTYSSKGEVRRNLQKAGFRVEKIPGASGKREMVRAFRLPLYHG